jgi:hypothetical protein
MKKMILALSAMLTVGLSATLASEETKVDPRVLSAFKKEFSFAQNVKWEVSGDISTARFSLNDQGFIAYFTEEGELLSTARNILYMQLPLSVIKTLQERYASADLSGVVEVNKSGETSYYMQAEEKEKKVLLQAWPSGSIHVVKKIKS